MEYLKDPIDLPEDPNLLFKRIDAFLAEQRKNAESGQAENNAGLEQVFNPSEIKERCLITAEPKYMSIEQLRMNLEPPKRPIRLTRKIEKIANCGFWGGLGIAGIGLLGLGVTTFIQNPTMEDISFFIGRSGLVISALSAATVVICNVIEHAKPK